MTAIHVFPYVIWRTQRQNRWLDSGDELAHCPGGGGFCFFPPIYGRYERQRQRRSACESEVARRRGWHRGAVIAAPQSIHFYALVAPTRSQPLEEQCAARSMLHRSKRIVS